MYEVWPWLAVPWTAPLRLLIPLWHTNWLDYDSDLDGKVVSLRSLGYKGNLGIRQQPDRAALASIGNFDLVSRPHFANWEAVTAILSTCHLGYTGC